MLTNNQLEIETTGQFPKDQPVLVFVSTDIVSGMDEIAREKLISNLRHYSTRGLSPLWVNWLRNRADLHFACLVHDLQEFNDFLPSNNIIKSASSL